MSKVLVCGGREFRRYRHMCAVLASFERRFGPITQVIHGDYRGADALADRWAVMHGVNRLPFPADWFGRGPAAGPFRNQQMIDEGKPDFCIAFAGKKGTEDMIRRAVAAGVKTFRR